MKSRRIAGQVEVPASDEEDGQESLAKEVRDEEKLPSRQNK